MALASQSVRPSVPRSSEALSRRGGGGGGGRRSVPGKRLVGVVMLAGLCVAMVLWAVRARDAKPAGAAGSGATQVATDTTPAATTLLTPNPLSRTGTPPSSTPPTSPTPGIAALPPVGTLPASGNTPAPTTTPGSPAEVRDPLEQPAGSGPTGSQPGLAPSLSAYQSTLAAADRAQQQGKLVEARMILNRALMDASTSAAERSSLRQKISDLNQTLLFGPGQTPGDPLTETYKVASGDALNRINRKLGLVTEATLIARVNKLANPNALRVGQTLKIIRGPFHAVVSKSAYRMDVYAGPTPSPSSVGTSGLPDGAEPGWMYICSFPVGLGEKGVTPIANFTVKAGSKLVNPHWVNPRTGEKFDAADPKNPIGERWMGLEALDEQSKGFTGYGIHGTIDPGSIGREMSMGCVRMGSADVEIAYELLMDRVSVVKIVP